MTSAMTNNSDADALVADEAKQATSPAPSAPTASEDHPEGDAIRRQVEYYLSDENLPTDKFLLDLCGGRENEPISISRICGFKKMRGYRPRRLVVTALRKSTFLEVSMDGKTIKRKVPFRGKCLLDDDFQDTDDIAHPPNARPTIVHVPRIQPDKKAIPPGLTKGMLKPTGFEATHMEGPITPQEAADEEGLYDADRPFVERIEFAIQRFKQKRRMHEMYANVFNKLMRFGGVEQNPRQFQGISKQDMAEMDAEEITRALAEHNVPWDREDETKWTVDFCGLAKAFLSSWYPAHYGLAPNTIKNLCQVPRSFYNYLRYHAVCPEYDNQLAEALKVCDLAEQELPKILIASSSMPGDFNTAASVILGGSQAGIYAGDKAWVEQLRQEGTKVDEFGLSDEQARIIFTTGVAIMGSDEQCETVESKSVVVLAKEDTGLEIKKIVPPTDTVRNSYSEYSKVVQHKLGQLQPLGQLICATWIADDCEEWDLPLEKYPTGKPSSGSNSKELEFWVEASVLDCCFPGMKMNATVLTLDCGIKILDEIKEVMCSFYTWLPNELWMDRDQKELRWLNRDLEEEECALGENQEANIDSTGAGAEE